MVNLCTHANAQPGDRFCDGCGLRLTTNVASKPALYCQCGAVIQPNDKFCDNCGAPLHQAHTPHPMPAAIPFAVPSARTVATRCVQCNVATSQNALLCPACQSRTVPPAAPPPLLVTAARSQPRFAVTIFAAMVLLLLVGSGYVMSLRSQNQRLQSQAEAAAVFQNSNQQTQDAPQYSQSVQNINAPAAQPPAYQQSPYEAHVQEYEQSGATQAFQTSIDAQQRKYEAEQNMLVVWECRHCKKQITRAGKEGMPHDMFDSCPALNYVAPDGKIIKGDSHSWIKVAGP